MRALASRLDSTIWKGSCGTFPQDSSREKLRSLKLHRFTVVDAQGCFIKRDGVLMPRVRILARNFALDDCWSMGEHEPDSFSAPLLTLSVLFPLFRPSNSNSKISHPLINFDSAGNDLNWSISFISNAVGRSSTLSWIRRGKPPRTLLFSYLGSTSVVVSLPPLSLFEIRGATCRKQETAGRNIP
ncbi:hypothetical protein B0H13DRAFT_2344303 [Mycena leptocephala]|nr:hypothetical protein B0H13DRAFT_2344303 [Mycena leptocephala]